MLSSKSFQHDANRMPLYFSLQTEGDPFSQYRSFEGTVFISVYFLFLLEKEGVETTPRYICLPSSEAQNIQPGSPFAPRGSEGRLLLRPTRHAYANHEYHILHFARFANAFLLSLLGVFSPFSVSPLGRVEISAGAQWIKTTFSLLCKNSI